MAMLATSLRATSLAKMASARKVNAFAQTAGRERVVI